jgi:hypothetical protein
MSNSRLDRSSSSRHRPDSDEEDHSEDDMTPEGDRDGAAGDTTSGHSSQGRDRQLQLLEECCHQAERQYNILAAELHVPALDDALYRKYLFPSSIDADTCSLRDNPLAYQRRLSKLLRLLDVFAAHKETTLSILESIGKREKVFAELLALNNNDTLHSLELQSVALQALYQLQTHTLAVVEGIVTWRSALSLPFAFLKNDENYLLRIAESMYLLEHSEIGKVLPLQFSRFPLCSNVPSMRLFAEDPNFLTYPLRAQKPGVPAGESPVFRKRLTSAEQVIHEEVESQVKLLKFLVERCQAGYFVPVCDLAACDIYHAMRSSGTGSRQDPTKPKGGRRISPETLPGIRISSLRHQAELLDALHMSLERLHKGPTTAPVAAADETSSESDSAQAGPLQDQKA